MSVQNMIKKVSKFPSIDFLLASMSFHPVYAGPAVRFQRYAAGLRDRGVQMQVFASTPTSNNPGEAAEKAEKTRQPRSRNGTIAPLEYVDEIPVRRVQVPWDRGWRRYAPYNRALIKYCRHTAQRFDLIQFLSLSLWSAPWVPSLRKLGLPLVYTHTMLGKLSDKSWKRKIQPFYWRMPFQMMDCIVISSGVMRDALLNLGVTTRIEVICNGVDLRRFRPLASSSARRALRQQLGLDPVAELILFVGPINPRKRVDVLVEAWYLLAQKRPRAHLVLVGPRYNEMLQGSPESDFQAGIEATIADSGAADRVIFTGPVNNVEAYLQVADLFVFPSRREGMPNVVPEAFGCGLASILTPFIGLPSEFGRPGEHYLLVERSPEALANAMASLLDSPQKRKQLGLRARKWAEEQMDVERSLDQYADLYHELAGRSRQGR